MSLPSFPFIHEKIDRDDLVGETPPPLARLNIVQRAVEMIEAASITTSNTKGIAKQRYGKYISNSAQRDTSAKDIITFMPNAGIKADKSKVSVVNAQELADPKTILDEEPFHDAYLFDAMAADLNKPSQVVAGIPEQKVDDPLVGDTKQKLADMIAEARATAEVNSTGTEEAYGNITKTADNN